MKSTVNSTPMRRRNSNRNDCNTHPEHRMKTSFERPLHISFYLNRVMDANGKCDRNRLCELFNTENYG